MNMNQQKLVHLAITLIIEHSLDQIDNDHNNRDKEDESKEREDKSVVILSSMSSSRTGTLIITVTIRKVTEALTDANKKDKETS